MAEGETIEVGVEVESADTDDIGIDREVEIGAEIGRGVVSGKDLGRGVNRENEVIALEGESGEEAEAQKDPGANRTKNSEVDSPIIDLDEVDHPIGVRGIAEEMHILIGAAKTTLLEILV